MNVYFGFYKIVCEARIYLDSHQARDRLSGTFLQICPAFCYWSALSFADKRLYIYSYFPKPGNRELSINIHGQTMVKTFEEMPHLCYNYTKHVK